MDELEYACPGVAQDFDRLTADRQGDIHRWVGSRLPAGDKVLVLSLIETPAGEVHRNAYCLIDDVEERVAGKWQRGMIADLEPGLCGAHNHRADDDDAGQVGQGPPDVGPLFLGSRRFRYDQRRAAAVTAGEGRCDGTQWIFAGLRL